MQIKSNRGFNYKYFNLFNKKVFTWIINKKNNYKTVMYCNTIKKNFIKINNVYK